MRHRTRIAGLAIALLAAAGPLSAQCAMCGESVAQGSKGGGADPALAFSLGVLVLLGVVFSLAGGLVFMISRAARENEAGATPDPTSPASATTPSPR
jgi:hypothetical protein